MEIIGSGPDYWVISTTGYVGVILFLWAIKRVGGTAPVHVYAFSIVWCASLSASLFLLSGALRPEPITLMVLFGTWWALLVGSLFTLSLKMKSYSSNKTLLSIKKRRALSILVLLMLLQLAAIVYEVVEYQFEIYGSLTTLLTIYPELRLSGHLSGGDLPWFLEIWRWGYVWYLPLAFLLRSRGFVSRKGLFLIISLGIFSALIRFTRAPLLHVGITTFVSWIVLSGRRRISKYVIGGNLVIIAIAVFIGMQVSLTMLDRSSRVSPFQSVATYFGGSMKAYDILLQKGFAIQEGGLYSFDALNFALKKLGLIEDYPSIVRPPVFLPLPVNVYTYLDAFTLDFGIWGAVIGSFMVGVFGSLVYRRVRIHTKLTNLVVYCYLVYACMMAALNNELIRFGFVFATVVAAILNSLIVEKKESCRYLGQADSTIHRNNIKA